MYDLLLWSLVNRTLPTISAKRLLLTQPTLPVLLLLLSLASCARTPSAETVAVQTLPAVKCEHPLIDPRTKAGLYEAIRLYWGAIEDCNARNGFGAVDTTGQPIVPLVVPVAPGAPVIKTTVEKVTTKPTGASSSPVLPTPVDVVKDLAK